MCSNLSDEELTEVKELVAASSEDQLRLCSLSDEGGSRCEELFPAEDALEDGAHRGQLSEQPEAGEGDY